MLGQDLLAVLHGTGAHKVTARTRAELDITDPAPSPRPSPATTW